VSSTLLQLVDRFPRSTSGDLVGRQLAKSATSVAPNYRAACVARSRAEFVAKLGIVFEEVDERLNCAQSLGDRLVPREPT